MKNAEIEINSHMQAQVELKAMHATWLIAKHMLRRANQSKDPAERGKALSFLARTRNQYLELIIAVRTFLDACETMQRGV